MKVSPSVTITSGRQVGEGRVDFMPIRFYMIRRQHGLIAAIFMSNNERALITICYHKTKSIDSNTIYLNKFQ